MSKAKAAGIVVLQYHANDSTPERPKFSYRVKSAKNTTDPKVGDCLSEVGLKELIAFGVDVSITGAS